MAVRHSSAGVREEPLRANRECGAALLVVIMMLLVMGLLAAALIAMSSSDVRIAGYDRRGVQAQFAAEAGVHEAIRRMALRPGGTVTANSITFDPAIADASSPFDPNWEVRIYQPSGMIPSSLNPSISYTPTVQEASGGINYFGDTVGFIRVNHKWRDRDGDNTPDADEVLLYDPNRIPPENFDSGFPINVVEVQGQRGESARRLRVEATRYPFSPNVLGAVTSDGRVLATGNINFCGYNHDPTTPVGTQLGTMPPCSPNYDEPSGHLPAVTTTGDAVATSGSSDLSGFPTVTDTSSANPFYSLAEALGVTDDVVSQVLADADYHSSRDADPLDGITFVNGDATGGETFNSVDGSGLLYVSGNLDVSGGFNWIGLIYVEGDFKITGDAWMLGAVMVRGQTTQAFSAGNATVLYSREAVRLALESAFPYTVLSWKEM